MPGGVVRVALVNDNAVVVTGLRTMLGAFPDRVVVVDQEVGELDDGSVSGDPDIVLVDLFGVTDVAAKIAAAQGAAGFRVVVFAWNFSTLEVSSALAAGAWGYLSKQLRAENLVEALELAHAGGAFTMSPLVVGGDSGSMPTILATRWGKDDWPGRYEGLSEREALVMVLIASGLTNDHIALVTYLSINTIKSYVRTAYQKADVSSRSLAVGWAVEHGLNRAESRAHFDRPTVEQG